MFHKKSAGATVESYHNYLFFLDLKMQHNRKWAHKHCGQSLKLKTNSTEVLFNLKMERLNTYVILRFVVKKTNSKKSLSGI